VASSINAITNAQTTSSEINERGIRADTLDAYKCVPFDPDNDVKNGTIQIDMNTGKPLTEKIQERRFLQENPPVAPGSTWSLNPGKIERFLGNSLGIFLAICFGFIVLYLLVKLFRGHLNPDNLRSTVLPGWINSSPLLILASFLCAFVGFLAGSTLNSGT
jgi:hypothetical protein